MNQSQYVNYIYTLVNEIAKVKGCTPTSFTKVTGWHDDTEFHHIVKTAYKCTGRGLDKYTNKQYDQVMYSLSNILQELV